MTETIEGSPSRDSFVKLQVPCVFSTPGVHPYDEVTWERRDVVMTNWRDGTVNFEQRGVEFPEFWSVNATNIVTTKYFRGAVGTPQREHSLKQIIDRVVLTYVRTGQRNGYFASEEDTATFERELTWLLLHQHFSFNSPVWFNVGTDSPWQTSACFILSVDDNMRSILNWYTEEGMIFKGGSGAGLNLSKIRSSKELLSSGGSASGPVSFMRGADSVAGTIKSGGATRRAAKMVILDVDHPDIQEFIELKSREEHKIRALREAGFDMDLDGRDVVSVQYQNANNSVRVSDKFMRAVQEDSNFDLLTRGEGAVTESVSAKGLFRSIAQAAWECADPGMQYDDTINDWHTCPTSGRITGSNPCSEFMHLDNSSCNLASLNLLKFLLPDGTFDHSRFIKAVEVVITAMEIGICFSDYPTEKIGTITREFRQLGIGYANLGALLMATGHAYDSPGGRALAASITSLLSAVAYRRSAEMAAAVGPYAGYALNREGHNRVIRKHTAANNQLVETMTGHPGTFVASGIITAVPTESSCTIALAAQREWNHAGVLGEQVGYRNSQASLLAPTGTIGFMMDVDTTGIEPDLALVKHKKLVGGASMQIVNQTVQPALCSLGYSPNQITGIMEHIEEHGHVVDAPALLPQHYSVFDCAMGERAISWRGHVNMMAAVQPFLSGAISKTVNLPESATIEEVEQAYFTGWQLGLKAIAVYRDNCKVGQPLSVGSGAKVPDPQPAPVVTARPVRRRLQKQRPSITTSFEVAGAQGYMTVGMYPHPEGIEGGDEVGEVFLKLGKQGSTLAGVMDAFSIALSIALQHGVPLEAFVSKFVNMRFDPAGMTDDSELRIATSFIDYIFRRLAIDHMEPADRAVYGIFTTQERAQTLAAGGYDTALTEDVTTMAQGVDTTPERTPPPTHSSAEVVEQRLGRVIDAPLCMSCGVKMRPAGSCYVCESCGSTSGCS